MPSDGSQHGSDGPDDTAPDRTASLEQVLDRYLEELAQGRTPDQEEYLHAYPELADALRGVFKTLDFVETTSRRLAASTLERGSELGDYRILGEVGRGGMGVVYEAVQMSLGRRVALKVLPAGAMLSDNAAERFSREAATAGRLHHTNIVPVYAVGQEQGIHYYAMQFIEGRSLGEHLKGMVRAGTVPGHDYYRRVARWGQQIAEALACAHAEGIVHRDIKPSNLLLDERDNIWVTDFGLARADAQSTITVSGDVIGTARYMSPEQARGGHTRLDERTDIYSLGATLYELLARTPAFDGTSREAVLNRITFADPPPLRQADRSIPRDLETIIAKCMEKDPERRYRRAGDVAEDCRRFASGESIRAHRTSNVVKAARFIKRHRIHSLAVLLAVVLTATTLGLVGRMRSIQRDTRLAQALDTILIEQDFNRAERLIDEAESLGADSAQLYLCRGLVPLLNTEPQRAIPPLIKALQYEPDNVEACMALSYAYFATGDEPNGNRYLNRYGSPQIQSALAWLLRGHALAVAEREGALECYGRATEVRADFTPAIQARANWRAGRLLVEGDRTQLEPMLNDYDAWTVFRPRSARAHVARGIGWMYAAAYARTQPDLQHNAPTWLITAGESIDRGMALRRPDDSIILARKAAYLRYIGDFQGAADLFAQALAVDRAAAGDVHPGILHHRVLALHALGDLETALREVEPVCDALPSFFVLRLQRVLLLAELGQPEQARELCRDYLEEQIDNPLALTFFVPTMKLIGDGPDADAALAAFWERHQDESFTDDENNAGLPLQLAYLSNRISAEELLAAARDHPGHRCTHTFVIGLNSLAAGDRQAAMDAFESCLHTGVLTYIHFRFAQVFAARAHADPSWPAWVERSPITAGTSAESIEN